MKEEILSKVDYTLLLQTATWKEIQEILEDAIQYQVASACIPPSFVQRAKSFVGEKLPICTVIGFPNGYHTTETKIFETKKALEDGADEIDMVINLSYVKEKKYTLIFDEIQEIKEVCQEKILKVIIETCLLTEEEIIKMCEIISETGAEYIKTSTGFSSGGATFEDVALMKQSIRNGLKIKAAGGISSFEDAQKFLDLGASRLGTSRLIKILKK